MARSSPMQDLYSRLGEVGFPRAYVKERILPDWWEDDLARDPGNRRLAELAISRTLKIALAELVEPSAPLNLFQSIWAGIPTVGQRPLSGSFSVYSSHDENLGCPARDSRPLPPP